MERRFRPSGLRARSLPVPRHPPRRRMGPQCRAPGGGPRRRRGGSVGRRDRGAALRSVVRRGGRVAGPGVRPHVAFRPGLHERLDVALGSPLAQDTSGYRFGTKITLAPNAGVRWYPARRISVRGDFRLELWKLHYPLSYKVPNKVDGSSVLPLAAPLDQWTAHPWATIGVGWTF